jgi:hypothetical protein
MRIGLSIFLIAVGAVLRFALETSVDGIDLGMTGMILMAVGALGLVISLFFLSSLSPSRRQSDTSSGEAVRETETLFAEGLKWVDEGRPLRRPSNASGRVRTSVSQVTSGTAGANTSDWLTMVMTLIRMFIAGAEIRRCP